MPIEYSDKPAPKSLQDSDTPTGTGFKIRTVTLLFPTSAGHDLVWSPCLSPNYLALVYPVVGFARKLPVTHGWDQGRTNRGLFHCPVSGTNGRAYLRPTAAGAKMDRRAKFLRHVEDAGFQRLWDVVNP